VVDRSSLSGEQKRAATATLDTCMSTNMTLPSLPLPPPHNHHPPPPSIDEINTLMNGNLNMSNNSATIHPLVVLKLVLCSAKALIQNVTLHLKELYRSWNLNVTIVLFGHYYRDVQIATRHCRHR